MNYSKKEDTTGLLQRKNKAINDCKEKHEKMMSLVSKINQQNEGVRQQIESECEKINQTLSKLKQRSNQYMGICMDALTEEKKNPEITCTTEVAAYLKIEKQLLKAITDSKQAEKTNRINLHEMLAKVQLQRVLRKLKRQQLQEQIRYLESNVIVKGNFIYNPSSSLLVSPTEEKQNLARMQNLVDQLQRVIKLSIPCATQSNNNNKLAVLKAQESRLQDCDKILDQQHNKMLNFTKLIEQLRNLPQKFSYGQPYFGQQINEEQLQDEYQQVKLNEKEINDILQMEDISSIVINMDHPFSTIESTISELRLKVKKLEKYSQ